MAAELLHPSKTLQPPAGAGPLNVNFPTTLAPPFTLDGETVKVLRLGGASSKLQERLPEGIVAVIVTGTVVITVFVLIVTLMAEEPAGMVAEAGTDASGVFEARAILNPPEGAVPRMWIAAW